MKNLYFNSTNFEQLRRLGFEKKYIYNSWHFSEKDFDIKKCPDKFKIKIIWYWHLPFSSKECNGSLEFQELTIYETKTSYAPERCVILSPQCSSVSVVAVKLYELIKLGLITVR